MAKTTATNHPQPKKKFILQDKAGEIVATLIDRELAEKWVSENKKGAVKITESVLAPTN